LGERSDQPWLVVPGLNEIDGKGSSAVGEGGTIKTHAGAGILRRQANRNGMLDAIGDHGTNRVGDEGLPIPHANVHRHTYFVRQKFGLLQGELSKGGAANQAIPMFHFLHNWRRKRPPTGHAQEKVRHLVDGIRAAMSQQKDSGFLWTGQSLLP
jgi:hypothetical protein